METAKLLEQMKWRYAVKKFDASKKISDKEWKAIEDTLVLTPSSYGLQPWKFIVVQNPEVRKKLVPVSWNQTQPADCSHFVVLTARITMDEKYIADYVQAVAKIRGVGPEALEGYRKMMVGDLVSGGRSKTISQWATNQAYIALGNLMTAAAILGIDTCPMEGIDPVKYDEILGVKDGYATRVACAVGYRAADDKYAQAAKFRFDNKQVIQHI